MAKAKPKTKSKSKEVALPWKNQLAKYAEQGKAPKEKQATGDVISIKGGKFSIAGKVIGQEMDCIILGYSFQNTWYDKPYSEGEVNVPACFAIGYDEDTLEPHATSPIKQHDQCDGCDLNEYGSGTGNGKACTNRRCIALVHESQAGEPEIKILRIPPTSLTNWKHFVNDAEAHDLELVQCAVTVSFDPESTAVSPPLLFDFKSEITNEKLLQSLVQVMPQAQRMIEQPFDVSKYVKPSAKKTTKKKSVKKKKSKFS
jgi:hypothetical protein